MSNLHALDQSPALLAAGAVLLAMVAIRAVTSTSFSSQPLACVAKTGDSLGFWLGIGIPAAFGLALCLAALAVAA